MKKQIQTDQGTCSASLKTLSEIQTIQAELNTAPWLTETILWLDAMKDPTRFKLILLLFRHDHLCGCDLANVLKVSPSAVSQHLRKLKDMGLVSSYRFKQTLFYTLCKDEFVVFFSRVVPAEMKQSTPANLTI